MKPLFTFLSRVMKLPAWDILSDAALYWAIWNLLAFHMFGFPELIWRDAVVVAVLAQLISGGLKLLRKRPASQPAGEGK